MREITVVLYKPENTKKYLVDDKVFDTREEAQEYYDGKGSSLVIYSEPDLTEGRFGYSKVDIFPIFDNVKDKSRLKAVKLITENILAESKPKYDGVMDSITSMMSTFSVEVIEGDISTSLDYVTYVNHEKEINIKDMGRMVDEATEYLRSFIKDI